MLNQVKIGEKFQIEYLPNECKTQLLRLGLCEGDSVECVSKIPTGPIVLLKDLQEIAIGHNFSKQIKVSKP